MNDLVSPELLRNVRSEIQENLSFTPKETDIYKIHQSGDLANLDGLSDSSLKLFPSLLELRNALYSQPFREHLANITGSGALSGRKTDMAINVYTPGCHLLCHDDVIGTRRISYILYLTSPDEPWQAEWGGSLRLYPTVTQTSSDGSVAKIPSPDHEVLIPPAFNRLTFFAVQPGESFHDVEEVYAWQGGDEAKDDMRIRTAISGWYHLPQEGEEGFVAGLEETLADKSSLRQLEGKADEFDLPKMIFQTPIVGNESSFSSNFSEKTPVLSSTDNVFLSEDDINFLIKYIAPTYLTPDTLESVSEVFTDQWSLTLEMFLEDKFSQSLRDFISIQESQSLPIATPDIEKSTPWTVARPPHKHRFLYQQIRETRPTDPRSQSPVQDLLENLLPSLQFYKWLQLATGQAISSHSLVARRFRRGKDYTLATGYDEEEPRLEITLAITPSSGWEPDMEAEQDADKHFVGVDEEPVGKPEEKPVELDELAANGDVDQAEVAPAKSNEPVVEEDIDKKKNGDDVGDVTVTPSEVAKHVVEEDADEKQESEVAGNPVADHNVEEVQVAPTESEPTTAGDVSKSQDPTDVEVGKQASKRDMGEEEPAPTELSTSATVGDSSGSKEDAVDVGVEKVVGNGDVGEKVEHFEVDKHVPDEDGGKTGKDSDTVNECVTGDGDEAGGNLAEVRNVAPGGDIGGYLAYMAGEDDANYGNPDEKVRDHGVDLPSNMSTGARSAGFSNSKGQKESKPDPAVYQSSGQDDEDDGVLFSMPAGWNKLGIVLRDKGALRFVKYVSQHAKGDRWDVCGDYTIVNQDVEEEGDVLIEASQIYDSDEKTEQEEETTSDDD